MQKLIISSIFVSLIALVLVLNISATSAQFYVENYSLDNVVGSMQNSQLIIQTLKYEPFPVNAGDYFDMWIEVQNTGQQDAKNATFEFVPSYPFESSGGSLVRYFGIIPGTLSAYKNKQSGDMGIQANQVIMKFRVKVSDSAPAGESPLKLKVTTDATTDPNGATQEIPIEIGRTRTDFEIITQDSTSTTQTGLSFSIANVGDNDANAVIVTIPKQDNSNMSSAKSTIVGNLAKGDFTTVTFPITPNRNLKELTMNISYTDIAGVRATTVKTVQLSQSGSGFANGSRIRTTTSSGLIPTNYLYLIVGIIIGILLIFIYRKIKKKK